MDVDHQPKSSKLAGAVVTAIVFGLIVPVVSLLLLNMEYTELSEALNKKPPFFTQSKGIAAVLAAPFLSAFMLALLGLLIFRLIVGRAYVIPEKQKHRFHVCLGSLMFAGLAVTIVAPFISNAYWGMQFRDAGYHRCPNGFMITSRWTQFVWVQDPEFCHMRMVRHMIKSTDHSREDLRAYLRELQEE